MTPDDVSDELVEFMTSAHDRQPASQQLRDAVLAQTTRTIRNRRRMRRAAIPVALLACYLGGGATVWLWPTHRASEQLQPGSGVELAHGGDPAVTNVARKLVRPEDDQAPISGTVRLTPYERLRRTGDQQLEKQDGLLAATRTYKKALQLASADQRGIDPDRDTWLLMALKQSVN